jgi:hypothetical protein
MKKCDDDDGRYEDYDDEDEYWINVVHDKDYLIISR